VKQFFSIFFLLFVHFLVSGQDSTLTIEKEIKIISDFGANVYGGIDKGTAWLGQINASLDIPTEKLKLWNNGTLYFHYMSTFGKSFSQYSGDLQIVSNIEAQHVATFMELWYAHQFKRFEVKAGIIDLNANFVFTAHSLNLINSSFGIQPTISANMPVPIFPVTALGGIMKFRFTRSMQLSVGLFDGSPSIRSPFQPAPDFSMGTAEGFLGIFEWHFKYSIRKGKGSMKIGAWIHSSNFDDHHRSLEYSENFGAYFIMDQEIFKNKNSETYIWMKLGAAPRECNIVKYFYGGGITIHNPFLPISLDHISFGVAHAILCNHLDEFEHIGEANETVLELSFQKSFGIFSFQPDFQYIIHPSGRREINNSLFLILRTSITI
jgi:porin